MALTTSLPRPSRGAGRGRWGMIARPLAVVLTVLAFAILLCGSAMAVGTSADMVQARPVSFASGGDHALSGAGAGAGMSGRGACEECAREDGRGHCDRGLPQRGRDESADPGPCATPAPQRSAVAAAPPRAATDGAPGSPVSRPPDLHQLQVLRV